MTQALQNEAFNGNFIQKEGTVLLAEGWEFFHTPQGEGDEAWKNRMPEYRPALPYPNRVRTGNAQQWFNFQGTNDFAGIYQTAPVTKGAALVAGAWLQVWSSSGDDPKVSGSHENEYDNGRVLMRVGLDPYGSDNPWAPDVIWTSLFEHYDEWYELFVEAQAQADLATIIIAYSSEYPVKHNDVYVDDAFLTMEDVDVPIPPPSGEGMAVELYAMGLRLQTMSAELKTIDQLAEEVAGRL